MKFKFWKIGLIALAAAITLTIYQYRKPRYIAGEKVPDFTATLADGRQARLSDLRGNFVLLQFWGSWCGPCRAENRHLTKLYDTFHNQGFEIFSIAIEQNERRWKNAIEQDGLVWDYHTVEYAQFSGPLAKQFNIHSIPTTFLINPDGRIMGVNLSPEQLHKMLDASLAGR